MEYYWPGAYSFKFELKTLLNIVREQIDLLIKKIDNVNQFLESQ